MTAGTSRAHSQFIVVADSQGRSHGRCLVPAVRRPLTTDTPAAAVDAVWRRPPRGRSRHGDVDCGERSASNNAISATVTSSAN